MLSFLIISGFNENPVRFRIKSRLCYELPQISKMGDGAKWINSGYIMNDDIE